MSDPLWSDDKIRGRTRDKLPEIGDSLGISEDGWNRITHDALMMVAKEMRDDYEAALANQYQRIANLEHLLGDEDDDEDKPYYDTPGGF